MRGWQLHTLVVVFTLIASSGRVYAQEDVGIATYGATAQSELDDLLPDADQVPAGLQVIEEGSRNRVEVAASFLDPQDAARRLDDWGWQENAYRNFAAERSVGGGSTTSLEVSLHRFRAATGASSALGYYADGRAESLGLGDVSADRLGDESRAVGGSVDAGTETTIYLRVGTVLARVSAVAPGGAPTADAEDVARVVVATVESASTSVNNPVEVNDALWGISKIATDLTPARLGEALPDEFSGKELVSGSSFPAGGFLYSFATGEVNYLYRAPEANNANDFLVVNASFIPVDMTTADAVRLAGELYDDAPALVVEERAISPSEPVAYLLMNEGAGTESVFVLIWGARGSDTIYTVLARTEAEREVFARTLVANLESLGRGDQSNSNLPSADSQVLFLDPSDPDAVRERLAAVGFPNQELPVDITGANLWRSDADPVYGIEATGATAWIAVDLSNPTMTVQVAYGLYSTATDARAGFAVIEPATRWGGDVHDVQPLIGVTGVDGPAIIWFGINYSDIFRDTVSSVSAGTMAQVGNVVVLTYVNDLSIRDPVLVTELALALTEAGLDHLRQAATINVDSAIAKHGG